MKKWNEITVPRRLVYTIVIGLAVLGVLPFSLASIGRSQKSQHGASVEGSNSVVGSAEKFTFLSGQGTQRSVGST